PTPALYKCAADQPIGTTTVTPDTGTANAANTILTQGLLVYFGMDDNTDNGEHDGVTGANGTDGAINGPSDGGGMVLSVTPQNVLSITPQSALQSFSATHPEGAANYSMGFCADGICGEGTTQQQTVYNGCDASNPQNNSADDQCTGGTPTSGNVYENNTPASTQEPTDCSSGTTASETCSDGSSFNSYRSNTPQQMNAEPGVQTYQDPDPQRSPAAPFGTPGLYAGTCGVYANDGGGAGSPGVISTVTGGNVNAPPGGYIVGTNQPGC
ncbi:MAG: hypothetical protein ACYDB3_09865, partial [Acidimicrobiales bacterium]